MGADATGVIGSIDPLEIVLFAGMVIMLIILIVFGKRFAKIKIGLHGIELDADGKPVDPKSPCPYTDAHSGVLKDVTGLNDKLDKLYENDKNQETETKGIHGKLDSLCYDMAATNKNMCSIMADQTKQIFYNSSLPLFERLFAGLKYIGMGNNKAVKKAVVGMAGENPEVYEEIILLCPDLTLE